LAGGNVIEARRLQRSFGDGLIAAEIKDLQESWMQHAEVVLRLLILKHVRNWCYAVWSVKSVPIWYRDFTRVGVAKMPDAKTMGRWGIALGPAVIKQVHDRLVQIAQANKVVQGRNMRVGTTVVESNIHYPTDSSLLGDGVRVLVRSMDKITALTGAVGAKLRDRSRSVKWRALVRWQKLVEYRNNGVTVTSAADTKLPHEFVRRFWSSTTFEYRGEPTTVSRSVGPGYGDHNLKPISRLCSLGGCP
jgi:hypothetical protein